MLLGAQKTPPIPAGSLSLLASVPARRHLSRSNEAGERACGKPHTASADRIASGKYNRDPIRHSVRERLGKSIGVYAQLAAASTTTQKKMGARILVVDDNRDAADILSSLIRLYGYQTKAVYSGAQAIQEAGTFAPDMVLLDLGMPGLDGYETVRRLREQQHSKRLIVVALTGWTSEEHKRKAYEAGFDLHVGKPLEPTQIAEILALVDPSRGA
jgi:CheY-like chemotaxis protein